MAELKQNPTLKELQEYVRMVRKERGWDKDTHLETFLLFLEGVGELAKAIHQATNLYSEDARAHKKFDLEEEFSDVLWLLANLADTLKIDLADAFYKKEEINRQRNWNT